MAPSTRRPHGDQVPLACRSQTPRLICLCVSRSLGEFGRKWPNLDQAWANLGQCCPLLHRIRPQTLLIFTSFGRSLTNLGQIWPKFGRCWCHYWAKSGRMWAELVKVGPEPAAECSRVRVQRGQARPTSRLCTHFQGEAWPNLNQMRPALAQVCSNRAHVFVQEGGDRPRGLERCVKAHGRRIGGTRAAPHRNDYNSGTMTKRHPIGDRWRSPWWPTRRPCNQTPRRTSV